MPSASLSRWTMGYFAAACLFLLIGQALLAAGYGDPITAVEAPSTLAVVHLFTAGWLGLLMSGALLQFVPVLIAKPLKGEGAAFPALGAIVAGASSLVIGFAGMAGDLSLAPHLLTCGALLLAGGYLCVAAILVLTIATARPLGVPARFVTVGLFCLCATFGLGVIFAFALSGFLPASWLAILPDTLPLHVALGLGGWLSFSALGVSYRLLPMFMLAPDSASRFGGKVWISGSAAIAVVAAVLALVLADVPGARIIMVAALGLSIAGLGLYGADLIAMYRARRRPQLELNSLASIAAFAALASGALWLTLATIVGRLGEDVPAIVYLLGFGWLTGLGLAKLYKIVPFLTWLECYGPVLGRGPTPRVQDLVNEPRARLWFAMFHCAVVASTASLVLGSNLLFRSAASLQFAAITGLCFEFFRARRLMEVEPNKRLPAGVVRPNFFLPSFHPTRSQ